MFFLRSWLLADELVYRLIQFHRTCTIDEGIRWSDPVVRVVLDLLAGLAIFGGG